MKDKERSKKEKTRNSRYKLTQHSKADDQLDGIWGQLSRTEVIIIKKISDELRNQESKTGPKVRGVRRPGDTAPYSKAARKAAAETAREAAKK